MHLTAYVFLGILCGSLILNVASSFNFAPIVLQYEPPGFNRFRSEAELTWFLEEKAKTGTDNGLMYDILKGGALFSGIQFSIKTEATTTTATAPDYSARTYRSLA